MTKWQNFLNSLATPGGNLFLLVGFALFLLSLVFYLLHHPGEAQVQTIILSTFAAFSGALLQAFKGRSTDVQATTTPPVVTSTSDVHTEVKPQGVE